MIHTRPDILTQLLALVAIDSRLQPVLDEQNQLYQVMAGGSFPALGIAIHNLASEMSDDPIRNLVDTLVP